jgi:toxin ParE1/3/4
VGKLRRIEWLPEAARNLASHLAYVGERNPYAAIELGDAIEAALDRLTEFPESARPGRVRGTRELVVARTPYIVVYRLEADAIVVLRVLHGAQLWPPK